jgi:DNA topoisomerase-2
MIAVNGSRGIGTGWSTNIPSYNPLDLIECVKIWLNNDMKPFDQDGNIFISIFPEIKPWYRGYTGEIVKGKEGKYVSWGRVETLEKGYRITELPVGMWTDDFEESLKELIEEKKITKYKNYSNPKTVDFTIFSNNFTCDLNNLGLYTNINTSNMVLFDENHKLTKYDNIDKIIDGYCKIRYSYYIKRKKYQLSLIEKEINILKNKKRFLEEVRDVQLF